MPIAHFLIALLLTAKTPASPIETIARQLLDNFVARRFDEASKDFTTDMRRVVTPAILAQIHRGLATQAGEFRTIADVRERKENGARVIAMILTYEKAAVSMRVAFDDSDRVSSIHVDPLLSKSTPLIESLARALFANFLAGRDDDVVQDFNKPMLEQLTPARLESLRKQTHDVFGEFKSLDDARQRVDQGFRVVDLLTTWSVPGAPVAISVIFDTEGRVAGLRIARFK